MFFSLLIFVFSYYKINNDLEILKKANEKLLISTESIKQAEMIGEFGSWQWDLKSNKFIYSDNQYQLLGCEPGSFEPNLEKYLDFVHPDDRHIIIENSEFVIREKKASTIFFRIIKYTTNI